MMLTQEQIQRLDKLLKFSLNHKAQVDCDLRFVIFSSYLPPDTE